MNLVEQLRSEVSRGRLKERSTVRELLVQKLADLLAAPDDGVVPDVAPLVAPARLMNKNPLVSRTQIPRRSKGLFRQTPAQPRHPGTGFCKPAVSNQNSFFKAHLVDFLIQCIKQL